MDNSYELDPMYCTPSLSLKDAFRQKRGKKKQGRRSLKSCGQTYKGKGEDLELINEHEMDIVQISNGSTDDNGLKYESHRKQPQYTMPLYIMQLD